jgi:tRNA U34 2-thiouridine synthase MnmA/TrmU
MKAVSLFSGGLDSQLAVCLMRDQGIDVLAINFTSPFFGSDPRFKKAAADLGIEYQEMEVGSEYLDVLKKPKYGFGKHMNPCIDCHAFMFRKAGTLMHEYGASFLVTGEVLGERPMSQNKNALGLVEKLSGYQGYILRPLSALLLEPTIAEKEGWVDRNLLLDISGRGRSRQMELADHYGLKDYPTPAGGCLLTQENFGRRLKRLMTIKPEAGLDEMEILKVGRHFYLDDDLLLVVGRNHNENERLNDLVQGGDVLLKVTDRPGPLGLVRLIGPGEIANVNTAAAIVSRYSDARDLSQAQILVSKPGTDYSQIISVTPMPANEVPSTV